MADKVSIPPVLILPKPPKADEDFVKWAGDLTESLQVSYVPQADRIENMIMADDSLRRRPEPIGSKRLFFNKATGVFYIDSQTGEDTAEWVPLNEITVAGPGGGGGGGTAPEDRGVLVQVSADPYSSVGISYVTWDTEVYDDASYFGTPEDENFTIPYSGDFQISWSISFYSVDHLNTVFAEIHINDTFNWAIAPIQQHENWTGSTEYNVVLSQSVTANLKAGDEIKLRVWSDQANYPAQWYNVLLNSTGTPGEFKIEPVALTTSAVSSAIITSSSTRAPSASSSTIHHGGTFGLDDDDHAQYLLASDATDRTTFAANWTDLTDTGATTLHKHDHGGQDGLSDDDHPAYLLASDATDRATFASNWTDLTDGGATTLHKHDHGNMDGLADDDHPQYLNKTGWDSPATSLATMSFNDGTREFTLTPTGASFDYWIQGVKYTKATPQTVTIDDTYGAWFIYFDGGTLTASQTPWGIVADDKAFVALVYWDADANESIRVEYELHGWQMDASTHEYLHDTFGTRWESGLAVGINGDNLDVTAGEIHDEDLQITITDSGGGGFFEQDLTPASLPILYRSGASGLWKRIAASTTPCYLDTNVLQVNIYSGGSWIWSPVTINQYCAYWVVASSDINEPVFLVPGQEDGATLSAAQDGNSLADMAFGSLPSAEHKVVARVIVRRIVASPYYELIEAADYRNVSDEPSGTAAIIGDHGALTGLNDADHPATAITVSTTSFAGILSGSDTLVQTALDTIDDHDHDAAYSAIGHTHTESDITDLGNYLPLSAGTSYMLTGSLYESAANPLVELRAGGSLNTRLRLWYDGTINKTQIDSYTAGGTGLMDLNVIGADSADSYIRLFRTAAATPGAHFFEILAAGSDTVAHSFADSGNVDLCKVAGALTVGGTAVSLDGHTHVEADITDLGDYLPLSGGTLTGDLIMDYGTALQVDVGAGETPTDAVQGNSSGIVFGDSGVACQLLGSEPSVTYNGTYLTLVGHSHSESDITDLDSYLPLTAGVGKAITGALHFDASGSPGIYVFTAPSTTDQIASYASDEITHLVNTTIFNKNLEVVDGSDTPQHTLEAAGDVDLCQQAGDLTVGGGTAQSDIVLPLGHVDLPNGYAVRGANIAGTHVFLIHAESGTYRVVVGNSGARLKLLSNDAVLSKVPTSALSDANHDASNYSTWVDETNHRLYFKVKYSNGTTVKSGYISLS